MISYRVNYDLLELRFFEKEVIYEKKTTHPGKILDEHYIKPLNLNLEKLAERLSLARNTLFKIRIGKANVTPAIAMPLAEAFVGLTYRRN